uniref:Uncharacterized protein n=1 Tax=Oryza brachyantha TaxID=4533 RepID=J3MCA1_ORYBR
RRPPHRRRLRRRRRRHLLVILRLDSTHYMHACRCYKRRCKLTKVSILISDITQL